MGLNPQLILSRRLSYKSFGFVAFLFVHVAVSLLLFFSWISPSLDGRNNLHIAADSGTYIYFADTIHDRRPDPFVYEALATFPNTLWVPVLLSLAVRSNFAMVVTNYAIFFLSLLLLRRSFSFSSRIFVVLLLLNPTTVVSLLSVNKEIVDLLSISLFLYGRRNGHRLSLFAGLLLAGLNRYEVCAVMLLFMAVQSKRNPLRGRRWLTVVAIVSAIGILLPLFGSKMLATRFEEAAGGGIVRFLDTLEMHYMYVIAVIPKIAENLFGEFLNPSTWSRFDPSDIANSYILLFNNLAYFFVLLILINKRHFKVKNDLIYLSIIGCCLMAISLVIQPRYFYFVYVLMCLQAGCPAQETSFVTRMLKRSSPMFTIQDQVYE
jgi:hypothetical protein